MRTTSTGIPVIEYADIGSTNAEAMRLGLARAAMPLWLRADRQTAGRGRSGRPWTSEPGNLYASLLVGVACTPGVIHHLSFVAAVAVVAAIRRVAEPASGPLALRIKWPNDVLIEGAKLAGILPESTSVGTAVGTAVGTTVETGQRLFAVIGTGINLAHAPEGVGRATTCLAAHGVRVMPQAMLDVLAGEMSAALALWDNGAGFAAIRTCWLADASPVGTEMSVHRGRDIVGGTFAGLDADGALILRDHSGYDQRMTFGDVTLEPVKNTASSG